MDRNIWNLEDILMGLSTATLLIDRDHNVVAWNRACEELTGIKKEDVIGGRLPWKGFYTRERPVLADLVVEGNFDDIKKYYDNIRKAKHVQGGFTAERWIELRGSRIYVLFTACPLYSGDGELIGAVETLEDITELKKAQEALEELAIRDALTGIYNRRYLIDFLKSEFERSRRYKSALAVGMLDLDYFKEINDSYGHDAGDLVLKKFSDIMSESIRKTDTCGRIGGEEFLIVFPNSSLNDVRKILERLRSAFAGVGFRSGKNKTYHVTVSIGASGYDDTMEDHEELLKNADLALYEAKQAGRNCIHLYKKNFSL